MIIIIESLGAATVRISTIYILAAIGSNFAEKSGILNMTIEGNMLVSAFAAVVVSYYTESALLGVLAAILVGMLFSAFYGVTIITARANQMISSLAFNLFATGITAYLLIVFFDSAGATPRVASVPEMEVPLLSKIPVLGKILFVQSPIVYVCIALVAISYYVLYHTRFGLRVISVGEHPVAASTVGINVRRTRYMAVLIAGALAGLAGAYLSISLSSQFVKGMTAGRGFIALSTVIVGRHKPINIALAGLLFGLCDALQIRLQQSAVPTQFIQMIPYVVTVIVITFFIGKDDNPAAIGVPY
jgi:Uncharacterized ABC-type transport system, permease component